MPQVQRLLLEDQSFKEPYDSSKESRRDLLAKTEEGAPVLASKTSCTMGYRYKLDLDTSSEKNLTRGIKPCQKFDIVFDKNGQPKPVAVHNHPRKISASHGLHYYGANSDTQFLLIVAQRSPKETSHKRRKELKNSFNNLVATEVAGLEHNTICFICKDHLSLYQGKSDNSSKD